MAHVYTEERVRRCLLAGVRSIEHANFVSEETVAMMAQRRVYLDLTFISLVQRIESAPATGLPESIVKNLIATVAKGRQVYRWAKHHGVPIAFGTDLWGRDAQRSQLREFEMRIELDDPSNIIRSATRINAELLNQGGSLRVIARGAYADLLVVDGGSTERFDGDRFKAKSEAHHEAWRHLQKRALTQRFAAIEPDPTLSSVRAL